MEYLFKVSSETWSVTMAEFNGLNRKKGENVSTA